MQPGGTSSHLVQGTSSHLVLRGQSVSSALRGRGNMAEASAWQKGGWSARLGRARNCAGGAANMGAA